MAGSLAFQRLPFPQGNSGRCRWGANATTDPLHAQKSCRSLRSMDTLMELINDVSSQNTEQAHGMEDLLCNVRDAEQRS